MTTADGGAAAKRSRGGSAAVTPARAVAASADHAREALARTRQGVAASMESARAVEALIQETRRLLAGGAVRADGSDGAPKVPLDPMFGSIVGLAAEIARSSSLEAQLRSLIEHAPAAIFLKDRELRYVYANRQAAALAGVDDPATLIGFTDADFLDPASAEAIMASDRAILEGGRALDDESVNHLPKGEAILHAQVFTIPDATGEPAWLAGVVSDVTAHRRAERALAAQERLYRLVFQQASEGIVLIDADDAIIEANPAACAILGYDRDELVGMTTDQLLVPLDDRPRSAAPAGGPVFSRDRQLRHRSGRLITADIAATRGEVDLPAVAIFRDVTERRRQEVEARVRADVVAAIRSIPPSASPLEIATAVDRAIVEVGGFVASGILTTLGRSEIRLLHADVRPGGQPTELSIVLTPEMMRATRRRIARGAFVDAWRGSAAVDGFDPAKLGIHATACLPLEWRGTVVGMLAIASTDDPIALERRIPDLAEFADAAATRLAPVLAAEAQRHDDRRRVRRAIRRRGFRPVFQPIVDLDTRVVVGYEGLTRFADGTPPDRMFATARRAGVDVELEIATLEAILDASGPLPANRYLSLNVSPDLVLAGAPLRRLLGDAGFNVVLEITEHDEVADYGVLRRAIAALGDHVLIAVDDAGSGFASLRHIVELRPSFVKLDRALIAGIGHDVARQAMVAGMKEFAVRLGVTLVAEGIETEAERRTLIDLNLRRGQGYLFGRPVPVEVAMADLRRQPEDAALSAGPPTESVA